MPQETNLNVSPYFDDFDQNKNYYKVLFKPGYPVQARELTTLQSILQNQIEKFGDHVFKEGAKVIPGQTSYNNLYNAVELNNEFLGVDVSTYINFLIGMKIRGERSGISAIINKVLTSNESQRGNATIYVSYLTANTQNNESFFFEDGENLIIEENLVTSNNVFVSGDSFASTTSLNSNSFGSSFTVSNGVYYLRGHFVSVSTQTIILDQYSNTPDYRIGFTIVEEIITSSFDETLTDNAKGFNNYAAPGADRLKITAILDKRALDDTTNQNFIEIARVQGGIIRDTPNDTLYNIINDKFAKRTFEESGNYYVKRFQVNCEESLNDNLGNNGIFSEGKRSYQGNVVSEDLAIYKISSGKAYVRGYEVEVNSPTFLDIDKPRTTKNSGDESVIYSTGPSLALNRVSGAPTIGIGNTYTLSLRDSRIGVTTTQSAGEEIGVARVFDFALEEGSYNIASLDLNRWDISLYDIQTYTKVTLNQPITLTTPVHVIGNSSGATGYLKSNVSNSKLLNLYNTNGKFLKNESFTFNGIRNSRVAVAVTSYNASDVRSIYSNDSSFIFNADTVLTNSYSIGICSISSASYPAGFTTTGISTITISGVDYLDNLKVNDLVSFTNPISIGVKNYAKITEISSLPSGVAGVGLTTFVKIVGVTTVFGVCEGRLPQTNISVTDLSVLTTNYLPGSNNSLYAPLSKQNVSNVNLTNSNLTIKKQYTVNITNNATETIPAGLNETFLPYDEERYSLIRSDGVIEPLSEDKVQISVAGLQIKGLNSVSDTGSNLIATLRKVNVKSKVKKKARVKTLVVNNSTVTTSGIGTGSNNDGLIYGNGRYPYGTRVQDKEISLNVPDIIKVYGIFESLGISDPSAPRVTLSTIISSTSTTSDLVIGEKIVGKNSNAIAILAESISFNQISLIYQNNATFEIGEIIEFKESGAFATISSLETISKDITKSFTFDSGQTETFYDYGKIIRKEGILEPQRKIKIYFEHAYYDSQDDGDITTANSYQLFDYKNDVPYYSGYRMTDIVDMRPRVSDYTVSLGARSPFEFEGRKFNQQGNSSANILASDESILLNYDFYLPRIDRIFVDKNGNFIVKSGTPDENPNPPQPVDDALEIASIFLPPYLYDTKKASIKSFDYKRYQMSDISKLETRIKNLEYYTTLSLLETETSNLQITDSSGLNRFKSGFFVDNFSSLSTQEDKIGVRNSVDPFFNILRPSHYTTSIDLLLATKGGLGIGATTNEDLQNISTSDIIGNNIKKSGDIITLNYTNVEFIKQKYATRIENVQPYILTFWEGDVKLNPSSDIWIDTVRLAPLTTQIEGNYLSTVNQLALTQGLNPQTGLGPVIWGSWSLLGYGKPRWIDARSEGQGGNAQSIAIRNAFMASRNGAPLSQQDPNWIGGSGDAFNTGVIPTTGLYVQVVDALYGRSGTQLKVTETFDTQSLGDSVVSVDVQPYIRSRNVEFRSSKLKPNTRLYAFFDGVDVTNQCFSKLLEISMSSGTFIVGETVDVKIAEGSSIRGSFRLATPNHKKGKFNSPTETFSKNPYNIEQNIPSSYSSTSTLLNIDTSSMSLMSDTSYYGLIRRNYILVGRTSKAIASVSNVRLISDEFGEIIGSFFIPDPNVIQNLKFASGIRKFRLTNNQDNNFIPGSGGTSAENNYFAEGKTQKIQEKIISIRNANVTSLAVGGQTRSQTEFTGLYIDPLAQSFACDEPNGTYLTKLDVYFQSKDASIPVSCQIRTMDLGTPTQTILPFSEVTLTPDQVNITDDASIPTAFEFESPVYIEGGQEYAIVLLSNSTSYYVWISSILGRDPDGDDDGQFIPPTDTLTGERVTTQPILGSLFKSQNASTWSPSQYEDLKFTLYRAEFSTNPGTVNFYNPKLTKGNNQVPILTNNPIDFISRKIRVGLSNTIIESDSNFPIGSKVIQTSSEAFGIYAGKVGLATGGTAPGSSGISIDNPGIGYTPASGSFLYSNVPLKTITGTGNGATANITISNGVAIGATISSGGYGYQVGDVLTVNNLGSDNLGRNLRISIGTINQFNQIILEDVQGNFNTGVGVGNTIRFIKSDGSVVEVNEDDGGNVTLISPIIVENDGLHFRVRHLNHGMHSPLNYVKLTGVEPDTSRDKINAQISNIFTGSLSVTNSEDFSTFEGLSVSPTNPGYALINGEIIKYTSAINNVLSVTSRGIDNSIVSSHSLNSEIRKYEINGVSLLRINKVHRLESATIDNSVGLDYYTLRIEQDGFIDGNLEIADRTPSSTLKPALYFEDSKFDGGFEVSSTQNMQYELLTPLIETFTPNQTNVSGQVRTVTGKSISGNEESFVDQGYSTITLGEYNYFQTPRLICSSVNEDNLLSELPGNKSLNVLLTLTTNDSKLSPCIDLTRTSVVTTSNRVNKIVKDDEYPGDNRVNSLVRDQNAFLYVSKSIRLQNPATSLKLYVSADINIYSDIRALYAIDNKENSDPIFELFPGFNNLNNLSETINVENSDGRPDILMQKNSILDFEANNFSEYEFTANNLPSFTYYRIKLILTSTNQSYVPKLQDIRAIALA
jgi:hypothetical protein